MVQSGLKYIISRKQDVNREADKKIDREKVLVMMMKYYVRYYGKVRLRNKLLNVNYFKRRYSQLTDQEKIIRK